MSKPTICVIVPVYKAAGDTGPLRGQRSGPAGRRAGCTCILVDDGSPDESGASVRRLGRQRIPA